MASIYQADLTERFPLGTGMLLDQTVLRCSPSQVTEPAQDVLAIDKLDAIALLSKDMAQRDEANQSGAVPDARTC